LAWAGSPDPFFLILAPNHIFGIGVARHFTFRAPIKGCVSGHVTS